MGFLNVFRTCRRRPCNQVIHVLHRVSQDAVKNYIVAAADVIFLAGNPANFAFLMLARNAKFTLRSPAQPEGALIR